MTARTRRHARSASSSSTTTRCSAAASSRSCRRRATSRSWARPPTASRAFARCSRSAPDVVLLDLNMPGISGVEALRGILKEAPDTHVVMLTVSEDAEDLVAALRGGALGYLLKNIDGEFLVRSDPPGGRGRIGDLAGDDRQAGAAGSHRQQRGRAPGRALAARARDPPALARGASNKEIARDAGPRREHGQDPRPAHPAQARAHLARAGGGLGDRERARRHAPDALRAASVAPHPQRLTRSASPAAAHPQRLTRSASPAAPYAAAPHPPRHPRRPAVLPAAASPATRPRAP